MEHQIVGIDKESDITDAEKIKGFIQKIRPDIVIHAAALTNVDYCEIHRREAYDTNVGGTKNLIDSLNDQKVKFIFISSDYVYDGIRSNFDEESPANPSNYYGKTKLEAEKIVKKHKNHLILRSTVIFGWDREGKNFFMQLFKNQKEGKSMKVPVDQYSNPTYINLLIEIIYRSILKDLTGLFVATGPETMNRYDFAVKICEIFDWDKNLLTKVYTRELGQAAKRPLNCGTSSSKIEKALEMNFPSLDENLRDLKSLLYGKK